MLFVVADLNKGNITDFLTMNSMFVFVFSLYSQVSLPPSIIIYDVLSEFILCVL